MRTIIAQKRLLQHQPQPQLGAATPVPKARPIFRPTIKISVDLRGLGLDRDLDLDLYRMRDGCICTESRLTVFRDS